MNERLSSSPRIDPLPDLIFGSQAAADVFNSPGITTPSKTKTSERILIQEDDKSPPFWMTQTAGKFRWTPTGWLGGTFSDDAFKKEMTMKEKEMTMKEKEMTMKEREKAMLREKEKEMVKEKEKEEEKEESGNLLQDTLKEKMINESQK
eukprot:Trichotokara_eunicae@DN2468_c0_g1_i1.p1